MSDLSHHALSMLREAVWSVYSCAFKVWSWQGTHAHAGIFRMYIHK